jgi:hypothetical protein
MQVVVINSEQEHSRNQSSSNLDDRYVTYEIYFIISLTFFLKKIYRAVSLFKSFIRDVST